MLAHMDAPTSPSFLSHVELAPPDPIIGVTEAFKHDRNPDRVNLSSGVYYDDTGDVPLLECVRRAESELVHAAAPRAYLPIDGLPAYNDAARALLLGADSPAIREQRAITIQALGGTGGLKLAGEGGLLGKLTKMVIEGALEGELDDHLGYARHDPEGRDGGNSRNGHRAKTVITDTGPVEISVPRDRDSSFEPKIVAKRQRRLTGVDDMVISLSAKGLTHGEIAAHLAEVYGAEVSKQTISVITDRVMEGLADWQSRPLDPVYAVIFIDAINVKIREGQVANRPIYLALGVTVDGERDVLGLWAGEHGDGGGAKFWLRVCSEIKNRGTADVLMVVCDG